MSVREETPAASRKALPKRADERRRAQVAAVSNDPALSDYLREWRRNMAREQKISAFIVLHDSTLEELCRRRPSNLKELREVPGIGERKADVYGAEILQALRNFDGGARAAVGADREISPAEQTLALLNQGKNFEEIARIRARQLSTIVSTAALLVEAGRVDLRTEWISPGAQAHIETACAEVGVEKLAEVKAKVPPYVSYNDIKLVVAHLRAVKPSETERFLSSRIALPGSTAVSAAVVGASRPHLHARATCPRDSRQGDRHYGLSCHSYKTFRNVSNCACCCGVRCNEFVLCVGRLSFVAKDGLFARGGGAVVHQAVASPQAPERRGAHFVYGIGRAVLHDAVAGTDVMKQKIAVGVNDLASQGVWDGEGPAVDHRAGGRGSDGGDMTGGATDLGEDLLPGLRVGCGQQNVASTGGALVARMNVAN